MEGKEINYGRHTGRSPLSRDHLDKQPGYLSLLAIVVPALVLLSARQVTYATAPPPYTTSHYEQTTTASNYGHQGCDAGQAGQYGIFVLDFGQPWYESGQGYGTILFITNQFVPTGTIAGLAENWIVNY